MSTRVRADCQKLIHSNYNAAVTAATKTAGTRSNGDPYLINFLYVENMDASINVALSFDGGTTWKTVKAGTYFSVEIDNMKSYQIKADSGTPAIECVYGVED